METFLFDKDAAGHPSGLGALIDPVGVDSFFEHYWDLLPMAVQGSGHGRFAAVMTDHDFVNALFDAKLGNPSLRYLRKTLGDRQESLDHFLRKKAGWTSSPSLAELAADLRGGTTIYVGIEAAVPSVKSFCRALFSDFQCQMSVNAYFSAGRDASAFDAHFDPQDVFVLQLDGEKEWRLWERERVPNPISGFPDHTTVPSPELPADHTVLMEAGDLLYLPRGTWHWPRSLDDKPSLHLTLTVVMPKPVDIMQWLIHLMTEEDEFRAALPFSRHQKRPADLAESLDKAIAFLSQKLASPDAKSMAAAYMLRNAAKTVVSEASQRTATTG